MVHLDHQDLGWLGRLPAGGNVGLEVGPELVHLTDGSRIRPLHGWVLQRSTQTATVTLGWEQLAADGSVHRRWELEPMPLHCVFRFEMEHLLRRVGFASVTVYGDFARGELTDDSEQMIWVARTPANGTDLGRPDVRGVDRPLPRPADGDECLGGC